MSRIVLSLAEWQAVLHEFAGRQSAPPPPGVVERIQALLAQAPTGWPGQIFALGLDGSSADAVSAVHASLTGRDPHLGQRTASVTEAMWIIYNHQQHDEDESSGEGVSL